MKKGSKRSKVVKKQPFAKRESSAMGLIVALTVFNLVYSYAIGVPLPRMVVSSYVESVEALGDAQVRGYEAVGAAVASGVILPAQELVASVAAAHQLSSSSDSASTPQQEAVPEPPVGEPESILILAPNQISIAK